MRIVEKRAGEGVFVRDTSRGSSLEALIFRLGAEDGLDYESMKGSFEAIVIVESNMARLAARRASGEELARLEKLTVRADSLLDNTGGFTDLDQEYHLMVGQLGKSPVLFSVASTMWIIIKKYASALHAEPDRRRKCAEGHRAITDAIAAGHEEAAGNEMERHLKGAFSTLLNNNLPPK